MNIDLSVVLAKANSARVTAIQETTVDIDGTFVVASLIENVIARKQKLLFILHHHGFGHFQGICSKMNMNLQALKETGSLTVIDVLAMLGESAAGNLQDDGIKNTLEAVVIEAQKWIASNDTPNTTTVIVDHPADIALAFNKPLVVLHYVKYLQALAGPKVNIIYLTGPTGCHIDVVNALIRHYAQVSVVVRGLAMGMAADISGAMEVVSKHSEPDTEQHEYHFQLMDRRVRIFAPGAVQLR